MSATGQRNDFLNMRVEPGQKRLIERAAKASGQSVTAFVLDNALGAARRMAEKARAYELSERDARTFVHALDNPPKANAALKRALATYKKKYAAVKREQ